MGDGVTVSVEVPSVPGPGPGPTPPVPGHVPPPAAPDGPLPFTGVDAGLWLAVAIALVVIGALVLRRNSPYEEASMKSRSAFSVPLTLALTLVLMASSALAFAQSTPTVTTQVGVSSRNLTVTDLAGQTLESLALTPGQPRAFKVSVSDTDVVPTDGFVVQSVLNDLYRVTNDATTPVTVDHATRIASSNVTVSYPATPISTLGNAVDLNPDYLLSGSVSCSDVQDALPLVNVLTDPICGLLGGLTGSATSITDVALDGTGIADIDLSSLLPSELPIAIGLNGAESTGAYTAPDCSGLAVGDTACNNDVDNGGTAATTKQYMVGTGLTSVTGALQTALTGALTTSPVASADGSAAIASAEAVVMALQGASSSAVRDLGNALASYTDVAHQVAIINATMTVVRDTIGTADLANVLGTYNAFPMLTVNTSSASTAGEYAGTLTITLVD